MVLVSKVTGHRESREKTGDGIDGGDTRFGVEEDVDRNLQRNIGENVNRSEKR